jgi:DNA processing protein
MESIFKAPSSQLAQAGVSAKHIAALAEPNWQAVEEALKWIDSTHQIITQVDPHYPYLLKQIHDPPLVLFVRGAVTVLNHLQIALVGSRHATPIGLKNAEQFARTLAGNGVVVTSGLAQGVDGAAHRGTLAAQGVTIGVAGTGLLHTYPKVHTQLVEEIVHSGGAIISEFPLRTLPQAANFPRRNRIIGGMARGVLVVEAALKSGSLITARHALEAGREVFAIPGSIHHPLAKGCHHLIKQGAKLVESAQDIFDELGTNQSCVALPLTVTDSDLSPTERTVLAQIEYAITPIDVIITRSRLTAAEVSSMLLALELSGHVESVPGGYIRSVTQQ